MPTSAEKKFDKYFYIKKFGFTQEFVISLADYISTHPSDDHVPLLGEGNIQENIPRDQALEIINLYLVENNAPSELIDQLEREGDNLLYKLLKIRKFLSERKQEMDLASTSEIVAKYNYFLETRERAAKQNPHLLDSLNIAKQQIALHNEKVRKGKYAMLGTTPAERAIQRRLLEELLPPNTILSSSELHQLEDSLPHVITTLAAATHISPTPNAEASVETQRKINLGKALSEAAKSNSVIEKFSIYNANESQEDLLLQFVDNTVTNLQNNHHLTLSDIQASQRQVLLNDYNNLLLNRTETTELFRQTLGSVKGLSSQETDTLITAIFNESITAAYKNRDLSTPEEIIQSAISRSGIDLNTQEFLTLTKNLYPDLQHHHRTQFSEARLKGRGVNSLFRLDIFLPSEVKLARRLGVDPSAISNDYTQDIKNLLNQNGFSHKKTGFGKRLNNSFAGNSFTAERTTLREQLSSLLDTEYAKDNPNQHFINNLKFFQDHLTNKQRITDRGSFFQKLRYGNENLGSSVTRVVNWGKALDHNAWNRWFNFTDNLPHNRLINWTLGLEERIIDSPLGYVFFPATKIVKAWDNFKRKGASWIIRNNKNSTNFFGQKAFIYANLFAKGNYTLGGFSLEFAKFQLSSLYNNAKEFLGEKVGTWFKEKIGNWLIKKAGELGLGTALAAISNVFAPILAGLLIIKGAYNTIKYLLENSEEIAKFVAKGVAYLSAAIYGIYSFIASLFSGAFSALGFAALGGVFFGLPGAIIGGGIGWLLSGGAAQVLAGLQAFAATFATTFSSLLSTIGTAIGTVVPAVIGTGLTIGLIFKAAFTAAQIPARDIPDPGVSIPGIPIDCTQEDTPLDSGVYALANDPISSRAVEIVDDLYQGFWCYWNRSPGDYPDDKVDHPPPYPGLFNKEKFEANPNPTYAEMATCGGGNCLFWCTWLPLKAYEAAGVDITISLNSQGMADGFKKDNRWVEAFEATKSNVPPGSTVYFHVEGGPNRLNHTALVVAVNQDSLTYVQSNASTKNSFITFNSSGVGVQNIPGAAVGGFGTP